jgi:hypothetical protein
LVWDTSPLLHAARAERLDVLGDIVAPLAWDHVVPDFVMREVTGQLDVWCPDGDGREVEDPEGEPRRRAHVERQQWFHEHSPELQAFQRWRDVIGKGPRNQGECAVFAVAEAGGWTVISDDRQAARVARKKGLDVHGSLWLLGQAVGVKPSLAGSASSLVDRMIEQSARYPFGKGGFLPWLRDHPLSD